MKILALKKGLHCFVSNSDYNELKRYRWYYNGRYVVRWDKQTKCVVYLHTHLMGTKLGLVIDHIDRNTFNNQRENLRHVTHTENQQNKGNRTSNFTGVGQHNCGKWRVLVHGKYLGLYNTEDEAAQAYAHVIINKSSSNL